jgi:ketol-acid reductoisomerase
MKIYYDKDADIQQIRNKKVAVIGYGSQGHAHALNMKESGVSVVIGLREGASWKKAEQSGLKVMPVADAVKASDVVMILAPDEAQAAIYRLDIAPNLKPGSLSRLAMASIFILDKLCHRPRSMCSWSLLKDRAISFDRNIRKAAGCRACSRSIRIQAERLSR